MNRISIYENGSATVTREIEIAEGVATVDIPVRAEDLDEVVASISVFGNVEITLPPTYIPQNPQSKDLKFSPEDVFDDFARNLAGQQVNVLFRDGTASFAVAGVLMGMYVNDERIGDREIRSRKLAIYGKNAGTLQTIPESAITGITIVEEHVREEMDKSLKRLAESLHAGCSRVTLTMRPLGEDRKATLQYTISSAPWKLRYVLRQTEKQWALEAQAVVDNNTDEDWKDVIVSVLTGEPISFSTDIAEICHVQRTRVNLASQAASGPVVAAQAMSLGNSMEVARKHVAKRTQGISPAGGYNESMVAESAAYGMSPPAQAIATTAQASVTTTVQEVESYFEYSCQKPVSIRAKQSAIIPLFSHPIKEVKRTLFYTAGKVYRAVQFNNDSEFVLGKGTCAVYDNATYMGKCIVPVSQKGEDVTLVHAVESGVFVKSSESPWKNNVVRVGLRNRVMRTITRASRDVAYEIVNRRNEDFTFEFEYRSTYPNSKIEGVSDSFEVKPTREGYRLCFKLPANATTRLKFAEYTDVDNEHSLSGRSFIEYLDDNRAYISSSILGRRELETMLRHLDQIADINKEIEMANAERAGHLETQTRVINLLKAGAQPDAIRQQWTGDVAAAETKIRDLDATILKHRAAVTEKERQVEAAFNDLTLEWDDK